MLTVGVGHGRQTQQVHEQLHLGVCVDKQAKKVSKKDKILRRWASRGNTILCHEPAVSPIPLQVTRAGHIQPRNADWWGGYFRLFCDDEKCIGR